MCKGFSDTHVIPHSPTRVTTISSVSQVIIRLVTDSRSQTESTFVAPMRAILGLVSTILLLASRGTCRARIPLEGRNNSSQAWPEGYTRVAQLPRNASSTLKPLYQPYVPEAPVFQEASVIRKLSAARLNNASSTLDRGAADDLPEGTCAPGKPCSNGACCSNKGVWYVRFVVFISPFKLFRE
jgi:hypothetical protein